MLNALLFSASSYKDTSYLSHTKEYISNFLTQCCKDNKEILLIPYAGVRKTYDVYEKVVQEALSEYKIVSIHRFENFKEAILNSKAILVGGGNSFSLLKMLYEQDLLDVIVKRVKEGVPYIGWSAGSNIAGKSIKTTNDMPIVMPKSFDSLNLFPHQINPHFISGKIPGHNGESREERLQEFLIINPKETVYAIPEGSALRIKDDKLSVVGHHDALKITYPMNIQILTLNQEYSY